MPQPRKPKHLKTIAQVLARIYRIRDDQLIKKKPHPVRGSPATFLHRTPNEILLAEIEGVHMRWETMTTDPSLSECFAYDSEIWELNYQLNDDEDIFGHNVLYRIQL